MYHFVCESQTGQVHYQCSKVIGQARSVESSEDKYTLERSKKGALKTLEVVLLDQICLNIYRIKNENEVWTLCKARINRDFATIVLH
jgi:hypothetical protein